MIMKQYLNIIIIALVSPCILSAGSSEEPRRKKQRYDTARVCVNPSEFSNHFVRLQTADRQSYNADVHSNQCFAQLCNNLLYHNNQTSGEKPFLKF